MENSIIIGDRRYVKADALAKDLGVHKRTVLLWAARGKLPVISVGHMRLFDLSDVADWFDK